MNFKKKLLITTSSLVALGAVAAVAVACSEEAQSPKLITGLKESTFYANGKTTLEKAVTDKKIVETAKIAVFTAGGNVADKSFNQSSFEAATLLVDQLKAANSKGTYSVNAYNTQDAATNTLTTNYTQALNNGQNIWIASGFQHGDALKTWLGTGNNKASFIEKKIIIVGVDWELDKTTADTIPGQVISLLSKTQEPGFVAGYASAKFLTEKYPEDSSKWVIGGFGGGDFLGVTDFLNGYLQGVLAWNKKTANASKKVKWYTDDSIILNTAFATTDTTQTTINGIVNATKKPQIILPVAGPLMTQVVNAIATANTGAYVIGVDTDQSLTNENHTSKFFTSILKKIAFQAYQVLIPLMTKDYSNSIFSINGAQGFSPVGETTPKNVSLTFAYAQDGVGTAKTYVTPDATAKLATDALSAGKTEFDATLTASADWAKIDGKTLVAGGDGSNTDTTINGATGLVWLIKEINK
ncbi:hypothetical protein CJJ23_01485 [Mycoplasmopsis agassizii]|uniref:ABC transporter substrate-binding protein PnrA-like domain-containing protein n=1 Tax=Mycoplasmopsis agassizii TaxID=33922 RepID=A0A269TJD9_9BACT|nr:BMP family ABC transporter substrate-binding protein [Mycoplasmopsis agassizii]PAK21602.1 hypothetical protein CJJ23_01485 [Mycoplasmopsis agassizii]